MVNSQGYQEVWWSIIIRIFVACPQTKEGHTPLYLAAQSGRCEVVKPLIFHNADQTIIEEDGWTALQVCIPTANSSK